MQYTQLGRTAIEVSRLCLGTMNFGPVTTETDAHQIMDYALEQGINFFDTANVYGGLGGEGIKGTTEEIIGRWFRQGNSRREKVVLATKVYGKMSDWPNDGGLSARNIVMACEASLRRLQTDHIDLYQMHHVDRRAPWEEIWQAMEQLVEQGKVIYVGSSNFAGWHIAKANEAASRRNFLGLVSEQSIYHLNNRTVELEVLPACKDYGMGVLPWSPLGGGLLGGVLNDENKSRRNRELLQKRLERERPKIERYEALCSKIGVAPSHVALAWLLANPVVTGPIIGPRTIDQLKDNLAVLNVKLDEPTLKELDQIFPGPGGTAPEAYAW